MKLCRFYQLFCCCHCLRKCLSGVSFVRGLFDFQCCLLHVTSEALFSHRYLTIFGTGIRVNSVLFTFRDIMSSVQSSPLTDWVIRVTWGTIQHRLCRKDWKIYKKVSQTLVSKITVMVFGCCRHSNFTFHDYFNSLELLLAHRNILVFLIIPVFLYLVYQKQWAVCRIKIELLRSHTGSQTHTHTHTHRHTHPFNRQRYVTEGNR